MHSWTKPTQPMNVLLRTKFDTPQLGSAHVERPRLFHLLSGAIEKRVTIVSAPAGYGKTTLLAEWLRSSHSSWAWLSLDRTDDDLATFLAYVVAAIQSAVPGSCRHMQALLNSSQLPPLAHLTTVLINELAELSQDVILVLDDYQLINKRAVHDLMAALVYRCPRQLRLVIATRDDPPLPLPQWRARDLVVELRAANLCFTREETQALLMREMGVTVPESVVDDCVALTEGWITALKLAAISLRNRALRLGQGDNLVVAAADVRMACSNRHVADYLLEDVFSRQPRAIREFLLRTSILDQFTVPLCDALGSVDTGDASFSINQAHFVLQWIERANLFIIPLDDEQRWYRFHHLFRELLAHRLQQTYDEAMIAQLHLRASTWLAGAGMIEPALRHALAAGEAQRAADLVEQHRHVLLDEDNWRTLERWLDLLPEDLVHTRTALLMARAWVLHFQARTSAIVPIMQVVISRLRDVDAIDAQSEALQGEMEVFRGQCLFGDNNFDEAMSCAVTALDKLPPAHAYARGIAAVLLGLSSQAAGKTHAGAGTIQQLFYQDPDRGSPIALRALLTLSWMDCIAGEWEEARVRADYGLKLAIHAGKGQLIGWAHYFLGLHFYQRNLLDRAIEHFDAAVQTGNGLHKRCAANCLIGLSLSYWAQGKQQQAIEAAATLAEFALEAQDPDIEFEAQAFRAHFSLLLHDIAPALHWAETADARNDLCVFRWTEAPLITRLRAFVADGTPASLDAAAVRLPAALAFARSTHNVWREVELLAIQALARYAEGQTEAALDTLEHALALARPGHFVRAFVDLGQDLAVLLSELVRRDRHADYAYELLGAFPQPIGTRNDPGPTVTSQLIEPLTNREMDVLDAHGSAAFQ